MRFSLAYAGLLAALFVSSEAFSTIGTGASFTLLRPSTRSWHRATASSARPAAASAVMELADGKHADAFGRRGALAALAGVILSPALQPAFADDAGDEVVVQGEMRFEEGTDKKLARVGGKGTCVVTLRCVGKGIISETKFDVEASQFPPPGKPPKGKEVGGGVPFVVKVKDLKAKTEKGRCVGKARRRIVAKGINAHNLHGPERLSAFAMPYWLLPPPLVGCPTLLFPCDQKPWPDICQTRMYQDRRPGPLGRRRHLCSC